MITHIQIATTIEDIVNSLGYSFTDFKISEGWDINEKVIYYHSSYYVKDHIHLNITTVSNDSTYYVGVSNTETSVSTGICVDYDYWMDKDIKLLRKTVKSELKRLVNERVQKSEIP